MNLPLADSEREEIAAAYERAEKALEEYGLAFENLLDILAKRMAYIKDERIKHLISISNKYGGPIFRLSCQRYSIKRYKLNRGY